MQRDKVVDFIVNWLQTYAEKINCKGFVIGISGGIDSALTSTLCAKTNLDVLCIDMPIHQAQKHIKLAQLHNNWLKSNHSKIQQRSIDLTSTFDEMVKNLPQEENTQNYDLALANLRARLRMSTLYYFAGLKGYLVVGTGNKIEDFGIGFYTKYGDGGVDISPIADLTKTEVYKLAKHLKIENAIINTKPTDGLFDNDLSDEDQIGATYPELEWAMEQVQKGKSEKDFSGRELKVLQIYQERHQKNKHKWSPIPICKIPLSLKRLEN